MNVCSACGTTLKANAKFCSECGCSLMADGTEEFDGAEELGKHKVFTKRYMAYLAGLVVVTLVVIGFLYGRSSGGGAKDISAVTTETTAPSATSVDHSGTESSSQEPMDAYEKCMADSSKSVDECYPLRVSSASPSGDVPSDTETAPQSQTCLEWKTNYSQRYVPGTMSNGASTWNGSSWVQTSPGAPGHWEQIPTGQTCVRTG
jgi:hypothetical protein